MAGRMQFLDPDIGEQDEIDEGADITYDRFIDKPIDEFYINGNARAKMEENYASSRHVYGDADAVRAYFEEIRKIDLLSREEELERGKRIQETRDAYTNIKREIFNIKKTLEDVWTR